MSTIPQVLAPMKAALDAATAAVTANTAGVNKLSTDITALLAKINSGGTVTAADVQPLVDQANALAAAVNSSVAAETAADQAANPPAPPTTTS